MIGNFFPMRQPQKLPQRQRIRTAPDDASLAVYPFEITDHVHAKIAPRRQRWRAHPFGIERFTGLLDEGIEAGLAQKLLQTIVENMARRTRHLRPCPQEVALNLALTSHRHCRSRPESFYDRQTESADDNFVNGLIGDVARLDQIVLAQTLQIIAIHPNLESVTRPTRKGWVITRSLPTLGANKHLAGPPVDIIQGKGHD